MANTDELQLRLLYASSLCIDLLTFRITVWSCLNNRFWILLTQHQQNMPISSSQQHRWNWLIDCSLKQFEPRNGITDGSDTEFCFLCVFIWMYNTFLILSCVVSLSQVTRILISQVIIAGAIKVLWCFYVVQTVSLLAAGILPQDHKNSKCEFGFGLPSTLICITITLQMNS